MPSNESALTLHGHKVGKVPHHLPCEILPSEDIEDSMIFSQQVDLVVLGEHVGGKLEQDGNISGADACSTGLLDIKGQLEQDGNISGADARSTGLLVIEGIVTFQALMLAQLVY